MSLVLRTLGAFFLCLAALKLLPIPANQPSSQAPSRPAKFLPDIQSQDDNQDAFPTQALTQAQEVDGATNPSSSGVMEDDDSLDLATRFPLSDADVAMGEAGADEGFPFGPKQENAAEAGAEAQGEGEALVVQGPSLQGEGEAGCKDGPCRTAADVLGNLPDLAHLDSAEAAAAAAAAGAADGESSASGPGSAQGISAASAALAATSAAAEFAAWEAEVREACSEEEIGGVPGCGAVLADKEGLERAPWGVLDCVQEQRHRLRSAGCRAAVQRSLERASEAVRYDPGLAAACEAEVGAGGLCGGPGLGAGAGEGRTLECLQQHSARLSGACKWEVFRRLVRYADDIAFNYPLKTACAQELSTVCAKAAPCHRARVACLQQQVESNASSPAVSPACKTRLASYTQESFQLAFFGAESQHCLDDAYRLCRFGTGLTLKPHSLFGCLLVNWKALKSPHCQTEMLRFTELIPLQSTCASAIASACPDAQCNYDDTLTCLRAKRTDLPAECRAEESRFAVSESKDLSLAAPSFHARCSEAVKLFCPHASPRDVFECLDNSLEHTDMPVECKEQVELRKVALPMALRDLEDDDVDRR